MFQQAELYNKWYRVSSEEKISAEEQARFLDPEIALAPPPPVVHSIPVDLKLISRPDPGSRLFSLGPTSEAKRFFSSRDKTTAMTRKKGNRKRNRNRQIAKLQHRARPSPLCKHRRLRPRWWRTPPVPASRGNPAGNHLVSRDRATHCSPFAAIGPLRSNGREAANHNQPTVTSVRVPSSGIPRVEPRTDGLPIPMGWSTPLLAGTATTLGWMEPLERWRRRST